MDYPDEDEDEAFLRQIVLSDEDRQRQHPTTKWTGGFRWFRSNNVVRLEVCRSQEENSCCPFG
jgi:hypothetical protein